MSTLLCNWNYWYSHFTHKQQQKPITAANILCVWYLITPSVHIVYCCTVLVLEWYICAHEYLENTILLTTSFHPCLRGLCPLGIWRWHVSLSKTTEEEEECVGYLSLSYDISETHTHTLFLQLTRWKLRALVSIKKICWSRSIRLPKIQLQLLQLRFTLQQLHLKILPQRLLLSDFLMRNNRTSKSIPQK